MAESPRAIAPFPSLTRTVRWHSLKLVVFAPFGLAFGAIVAVVGAATGFLVCGGIFLVVASLAAGLVGAITLIAPTRHSALVRLGRTHAERLAGARAVERELGGATTGRVQTSKGAAYLSEHWLCFLDKWTLVLLPRAEVVWIWIAETKTRFLFIPTGTERTLKLRTRRDSKPFEVTLAPADLHLYERLERAFPHALFGWRKEWDAMPADELAAEAARLRGSGALPAPSLVPPPFAAPSAQTFPTASAVGAPVMQRGRGLRRALLVPGAIVGVLALGCCGASAATVSFGAYLQLRFSALRPACDDVPVPTAAPYAGASSGVLAFVRGSGIWTRERAFVPRGFVATHSTETTGVVLCVEPDEQVSVETCKPTSRGTVTRYRHQRRARVVVARTARVLADQLLLGREPLPCKDAAGGVDPTSLDGPPVDGSDSEPWRALLTAALSTP